MALLIAVLTPVVASCDCGVGHVCNTSGAVAFGSCWESAQPKANQNCTAICSEWSAGVDWRLSATRTPRTAVDTQSRSSWNCEVPGALELVTGGGTHATMVYFQKRGCGASCAAQLSCAQAIEQAMQHAKRANASLINVSSSLTHMWGCGPTCASTSALVDVDSDLAKLKYGLMTHFEATSGMEVDTSLWGATAHIQTVWPKSVWRGAPTGEATGMRGSEDLDPVGTACAASIERIEDHFASRNASTWSYADRAFADQFAPVYYLANHSLAGVALSKGEGTGLQVRISDVPCKYDPALCRGAAMASGHLTTKRLHSYGDYVARLRAPHSYPDGSKCDEGIYGYFTAGYVNSECGVWNEINFGFHPDRDDGGRKVSLELHADTGGYHETSVDLGFNYREGFHTFRIKHRPCDVSWWVEGKCVHAVKECLTQPMHTSLILRTSKAGVLPSAEMEVASFSFTPWQSAGVASTHYTGVPPVVANSTPALVAWHNANPTF